MSGIVSAITRAVWAFIVLGLAAVVAVAATDDPLAWRLLSLPGAALIGAASLALGWVFRARRPREAPNAPARETRAEKRKARREPALAGRDRAPAAAAEPARPPAPPAAKSEARRVTPVLTRREGPAPAPEDRTDQPAPPATAGGADAEAAAPAEEAAAPGMEPAGAAEEAGPAVPVHLPPPTGNAWADACFDVAGLGHRPETRRWVEIPALVEARRLRLSDEREAALLRLGEIRAAFPDHDGVYLWSAEALERAGDTAGRDAMLEEGLGRARAKEALLAALGTAAAEAGRLPEAIRRLVQSAALQLGTGERTTPAAFVELAALSAPHRQLAEARDWLASEAEASDLRAPDLDEATRARREALSREEMEPWMVEAIGTLWRFYR